MAIRRNDVLWPAEAQATFLFPERVGPVCRADLVDEFFEISGTRVSIRESAVLLHTKTRLDAWQTWSELTGASLTGCTSKTFEHFYFSLQAAAAGVGAAIGPWQLVRAEIESGMLAAPMGFAEDGSGYYLLSTEIVENSLIRKRPANPS